MTAEDSDRVQDAMRRAAVLAEAGRLDDLRSGLSELLAMAPEHLGALQLAAWCALEQGVSAEAHSIAEKLSLLDPDGLVSQRLRVRTLMACRGEAIRLARRVSEHPNATIEDRIRYARVCAAVRPARNTSDALKKLLNQAEATAPLPQQAAYDLLRAALLQSVAPHIRRALALFMRQIPNHPRSLAWASHAHLRLRQNEQALGFARQAIAAGPNESIAWQVLAQAREASGDPAGAAKAWLEYRRLRDLRRAPSDQSTGSNGSGQNSTIDSSLITSML